MLTTIFFTQFTAAALLRCLVAIMRIGVDRFFPDWSWAAKVGIIAGLSLPIMAFAAYMLALMGDGTLDILAILMGALAADFAMSFFRNRTKEAEE